MRHSFKLKRTHKIILAVVAVLFIFLFFLSDIIENYVNKNGEELLGRKVNIEEIHINYLKCAVELEKFTLYEENKKDTFVHLGRLYLNFQPWKLFAGEYAVSALHLNDIYASVIQNGEQFNFDDMTASDPETEEAQDTTATEESDLKFSINDIRINGGLVRYEDKQIDSRFELKDLDWQIPSIAWNNQESNMGLNFALAGGEVGINADIDHAAERYQIGIDTKKVDLSMITNYLKDYLNVESLTGLLTSNISIDGSMKHVTELQVKGQTILEKIKIDATQTGELFRAEKLTVDLSNIDMKTSSYELGDITLVDPVISVKQDKESNSIMHFFAPVLEDSVATETPQAKAEDSQTEQAAEGAAEEELHYSIKQINIEGGEVAFVDESLHRKFAYNLKDIKVAVSNISESSREMPLKWSVNMNNKGDFHGEGILDLLEPFNAKINAQVKNLELLSFSPYTEYYIAYPITKGAFNYNFDLDMTPKKLRNQNDIKINEFEFGSKVKTKPEYKLPIKLALYLIKDKDDNIEFNVPVKGNPSEPGFKVAPIILKTFAKFILKTATQPFNAFAKLVGTSPEEIETLEFELAVDSLGVKQRQELDRIVKILEKKPDLIFSFQQQTDTKLEKEVLAIQMMQQRYKTEKQVAEVADNDPAFVTYVSALVGEESASLSLADKCQKLVAQSEVDNVFNNILKKRNDAVRSYLIDENGVESSSVIVETADLRNLPEELKTPKFAIEVSVK
ncbi:DUF748 domain-containing protein [Puteibacter caeruleilacunae]|nr:DUF748 domain-containing protein [Puteibacter caeruleilacunae]